MYYYILNIARTSCLPSCYCGLLEVKRIQSLAGLQGHNSRTTFYDNWSSGWKVESGDMYCFRCVHCGLL